MLDIAVIRVLSNLLAVGMLFRAMWFGFTSKTFLPKRKRDLGKVKPPNPQASFFTKFGFLALVRFQSLFEVAFEPHMAHSMPEERDER